MKQILICIYFIIISFQGYSQTIKGTVTDDITHEGLPGVTISTSDNAQHTITDAKGRYSITLTPSAAGYIQFSMMGYANQSVSRQNITPSDVLDVRLVRSSIDLQPVIISANRERQARQDAPIAISKISSVQIQDTKATALYQLLNKVAGVYMVNLGNEQHTMAIRQPITYNALYLYMEDGLPIRPTGIFNHNSLYEINMSGVRDIEVIKGPASSLYGSNSVGGAVNFITQNPPSGYSGNVAVQGDNYHYRRVDANAGFSSGKFGMYAGGYIAHQKDSWQDYSDFDKYSANLKATFDFDNRTKLTAAASYNNLDTQTPGSLDSIGFYNRSYGSNQRFTYRKVNAFRANMRLEHNWDEHNSTFLTAFYRDNSTAQLPSYYISDVRSASGAYLSSNGQVTISNLKATASLRSTVPILASSAPA
jgi:iron complex outermembrane receptor protein